MPRRHARVASRRAGKSGRHRFHLQGGAVAEPPLRSRPALPARRSSRRRRAARRDRRRAGLGERAAPCELRRPLGHTFGPAALGLRLDLRHWIDDTGMVLFFFVVGLEIARELRAGELVDRRRIALPSAAAIGGMVIPALIYLAFNTSGSASRGWGIPMATDIAFAVGVLALMGDRIPDGLRIFLLSLAIVDDIGAVAVIAIFYSRGVEAAWGAAAIGRIAAYAYLRASTVGGCRVGLYSSLPSPSSPGTGPSGRACTRPWPALRSACCHPCEPMPARRVRATRTPAPRRSPATSSSRSSRWPTPGYVWTRSSMAAAFGSPIFWGVAVGLVVGKLVGIAVPTVDRAALRLRGAARTRRHTRCARRGGARRDRLHRGALHHLARIHRRRVRSAPRGPASCSDPSPARRSGRRCCGRKRVIRRGETEPLYSSGSKSTSERPRSTWSPARAVHGVDGAVRRAP